MASRVTVSKTPDEGDLIKIYVDFSTLNKKEEQEVIENVKTALNELKDFNKTMKKVHSM